MLSELRSCKIVDTVRNVENAITFELKLRRQDEETIYTKDGLLEDLQCNRIARLTTKAILQIYE